MGTSSGDGGAWQWRRQASIDRGRGGRARGIVCWRAKLGTSFAAAAAAAPAAQVHSPSRRHPPPPLPTAALPLEGAAERVDPRGGRSTALPPTGTDTDNAAVSTGADAHTRPRGGLAVGGCGGGGGGCGCSARGGGGDCSAVAHDGSGGCALDH